MRQATLTRNDSTDQGTPGRLKTDKGFECASIELPYVDADGDGLSDNSVSSLPPGTYIFERWKSPSRGWCYKMKDDDEAPNREYILIHSANVAGDKAKGYASQLEGCIALGADAVEFKKGTKLGKETLAKDQIGVSASRNTVKAFENHMGNETFELKIIKSAGQAATIARP